MRRRPGITVIALLYLLTGLAHFLVLAAIGYAVFFSDLSGVHPLNARALFPVGLLALGLVLFLAASYGLWRLRKWGRWLGVIVAGLVILVFVVGFHEGLLYSYSDIFERWDLNLSVLMLPYYMIVWTIKEGADRIVPELSYEIAFVARYSLGVVVNGLIVRYLLSGRVKQAFSRSS